jgi:hypothetical protein
LLCRSSCGLSTLRHENYFYCSSDRQTHVLHLAESCGLFQAEELGELGGMIDAFLSGELEGHQWLVLRDGEQVKAAAYYAPETSGTSTLLASWPTNREEAVALLS